jgi:sarcosine oxidase
MKTFDVAVIGMGGMGSAAAFHLARRGYRVLGLERFGIAHDRGASHGGTRILRLAYFQDPVYVPLVQRAQRLWRVLAQESGESLLLDTGSVDAGLPGSRIYAGALAACVAHDLPHEIMTSSELSRRVPGCQLPPALMALWQPDGGVLMAEPCVRAHTRLAQARGAAIHPGEQLMAWSVTPQAVQLITDRAQYTAARCIVTAGAWSAQLLSCLRGRLSVERQVMGWFAASSPALFAPSCFPVFNVELPDGHFYAIPDIAGAGLKAGRSHHLHQLVQPDQVQRTIDASDRAVLTSAAQQLFPQGCAHLKHAKTCLYTLSTDEHFIIDQVPGCERVAFAAGFSGHGFKFCSVIGEELADWADRGRLSTALAAFRLQRFENAA